VGVSSQFPETAEKPTAWPSRNSRSDPTGRKLAVR
jgi:hypothetical protein